MGRLTRSWMDFWFAPASPVDLGAARLFFYCGVLLAYGGTDFSAWGDVSSSFWMPIPLFDALGLQPLSPAGLSLARILWCIALVSSAVGLRTGLSTRVAFVLGLYLLGLPHNFGHTFHFDSTLVIAMGILACSRCGDAWSVDAMRRGSQPPPSGDYRWPVRAVWLAMALVFLPAGIAKLRYGGVEWMLSSNLSITLMRAAYHVSDADPIGGLGLFVARHEWLSRLVAIGTVVVELGFVSALFWRRARLVFVPAAFLMLVGIRVMMGPTFGGFLVLNVFWVPWAALAAVATTRLRARHAAPGRTTATATDITPVA